MAVSRRWFEVSFSCLVARGRFSGGGRLCSVASKDLLARRTLELAILAFRLVWLASEIRPRRRDEPRSKSQCEDR